MSKRVALVLSIVFTFPLVALANSNDFKDSGGQITTNGTSLTLSGSSLSTVSMNGMSASGNLGSVSFTTGSLISGNLNNLGTFAAGGKFVISGNGTSGMPNGVLFQGTFTGPVTWKAIWNPKGMGGHGNWTYQLSGMIGGTLVNGQKVSANFVAFTNDVPKGQQFSSSVNFKDGIGSSAASVPEPGTLALLGTGLVGLGMLGFRKRSAH